MEPGYTSPRAIQQMETDLPTWSFYDQHYMSGELPPMKPGSGSLPTFLQQANAQRTTTPLIRKFMHNIQKGVLNRWLRWVGILVLILALGALGSTKIMLDGAGAQQGRPVATRPQATHAPLRITPTPNLAPTPSPAPTPTIQVTPSPVATTPPDTGQPGNLPAAWTYSGRGVAEFYEAANVAEMFVSNYESFNWRNKSTFSAATFFMTPAAINRFYANDNRAKASFVNSVQSAHKIFAAHVLSSQIHLLKAQQGEVHFFAWMQVEYLKFHQQDDQASFTNMHSIVVLLVSTTFAANGITWEVSDWKEGDTITPIPIPTQEMGGP